MLSVFVLKRRTDGLGEQNLNLSAVCECFSYRRSRKGQCAMEFSGGLDNFLKEVFNHSTIAQCFTLATLDANNKMSLLRDENIMNRSSSTS